ncbi:cation diffusion facilitator family transporter [Rhodopila sp.]|uniref:cation diffusion facilitator family transporter n=1 Tax=Rhodopila sp. TaxID=2480087 RepID=UPI002BEA6E00|nr:cation diffusion facilitator family transporter [Rhodopila sp.]HVZ09309.1 cation diffusion facilitator family transporter [Rhodopila sp.]
MNKAEHYAAGSLAVGCAVLGMKTLAWRLTGSAALYSDALESIVNVAASLIAWAALRFAARPADESHPYGHDKAEFFSAVIEGVLIILAALLIFNEAWLAWVQPRHLSLPVIGILVNAVATALNGGWSCILLRVSRRLRSPALQADGRHLLADVVTSAGIAIGVALAVLTGWIALDALLAAATGIYVLWSGTVMIRGSVGGLMDAAPEPAVVERIRTVVAEAGTGAIEAHDFRSRHAGRHTFLQFHLVVPGAMSVADAHAICDRIEAALKADIPHVLVTIHVEPEEKAKHVGHEVQKITV